MSKCSTLRVFSLNAKNLRGNVWVASRALFVNGNRTDFLPKATAEARAYVFASREASSATSM
jgi:hypothetical protein